MLRILPFSSYLAGVTVVAAVLLILRCEPDKKTTPEDISDEEAREFTWRSDWDSRLQDMVFVRGEKVDSLAAAPENFELLLNKQEPFDVSYLRVGGDTIFVRINNASQVGEQMGSAGAREYLGVVTLTFSEIPGVKWVYLDFQEGSHAVPGIYSRSDFLQERPVSPLPL